MANKKASQKSILQTIARTSQNRIVRSKLRTLSKKLIGLIKENSSESRVLARTYVAELDKAVKKNVIHSNAANRRKSALSKVIFK